MASEEWDDHDRSQKTIASDLAKNYLESCAPNAILISFGDNDTYPLWYAQEVEGIRKDVRVINSSLLGTDWYINQLRYKVNESDPIDVIWTAEQIEGTRRDAIKYNPKSAKIDPNQAMDLYTMMKDYAGSDDESKIEISNDDIVNTFPSKNVFIQVDSQLVYKNGTVNANDKIVNKVSFNINKNVIYKNDAAILNIIAANKWKRPIYFTSQFGELGFENYLRQDGLTYRLVPIDVRGTGTQANADWVKDKMLNKFSFSKAPKGSVYYDEENRRHLNGIRLAYAQAAISLVEQQRKQDAIKLLQKCDSMLGQDVHPYAMPSRFQQHNQYSMQMLLACYQADEVKLAEKISSLLKKDMEQQAAYYRSLPENKRDGIGKKQEIDTNESMLKAIIQYKEQSEMMKQLQKNQPAQNVAPTDTAKP
jgi:hypothetical protein